MTQPAGTSAQLPANSDTIRQSGDVSFDPNKSLKHSYVRKGSKAKLTVDGVGLAYIKFDRMIDTVRCSHEIEDGLVIDYNELGEVRGVEVLRPARLIVEFLD